MLFNFCELLYLVEFNTNRFDISLFVFSAIDFINCTKSIFRKIKHSLKNNRLKNAFLEMKIIRFSYNFLLMLQK